MAQISGGELFARALKKEGIDCVFTLSGGHIMSILYGCRDIGMRVVDTRHECAAGYAANAYAVTSGRPGVLITTAGPGVTNATTAMAEAFDTGVPLVHIGGASPRVENETAPLQNVKSFQAMEVFSKWARVIHDAHRIPEYVAMAFRYALDDTPGPVYLEISTDVLRQKLDEDTIYWPEAYRTEAQPWGDPELIDKAAQWLVEAERPAILVGDHARFSTKHAAAIGELARYLDMPVQATTLARGVFGSEYDDANFTESAGATGAADVLLELGVNHTHQVGKGRKPRYNSDKRIMVHPDVTKVGYNAPAHIGIVAGASEAATQLLAAVKAKTAARSGTAWMQEAKKLNDAFQQDYLDARTDTMQPPHPGRCAWEVAKFVAEEERDWHVVCDGGDSSTWIFNEAKAGYPGQVLRYGPLGTIGVGAGMTLGGHMADGKPVLYYTGDGSFGFYSMEFDTFARFKVPVVCVISNDSAWGMIKLSQAIANADYVKEHGHLATTLEHMRAYHELPKAWGGIGVLVTKWEDIAPAIRKVRDSGMPGIVNVQVDEEEMGPSTKAFAGVPPTKK
ncbi:MAG: thiamine pyrophosphate-binding protein [Ruminococcaceae bacterium]|nr:thiamine pyrophosphate-binding protein [Oscillospiraceae bacterium]